MASIICRNGSQHSHSSVAESRTCWSDHRIGTQAPRVFQPLTPIFPRPEMIEVTEGFWVVGSGKAAEVFKVKVGDSGHLYGSRLEGSRFAYFKGAVNRIRNMGGRKLTLAEASGFGKLYGRCMICNRTLSNDESIARGIGPVCAEKL